jgi:hypothetical protein
VCRPTVILQQLPGFISLIICFRESVPPECPSYASNLALFAQLVTASKEIECGDRRDVHQFVFRLSGVKKSESWATYPPKPSIFWFSRTLGAP